MAVSLSNGPNMILNDHGMLMPYQRRNYAGDKSSTRRLSSLTGDSPLRSPLPIRELTSSAILSAGETRRYVFLTLVQALQGPAIDYCRYGAIHQALRLQSSLEIHLLVRCGRIPRLAKSTITKTEEVHRILESKDTSLVR